ncbi:beta-lactamase [Aureococcus anophagefferens]|nr:beta-lactamase [Aureococcus anophagefferens]
MGSLERPVCVLLALAAGCGTAVQSVVNFSLSQHVLGDELQRKFVAGFVSFAGGACLMVVCNAALAAYRHVQHRRDPLRHRDECRAPRRCWHCCGGLLGSTGMTLLLVANGRVGYALPSVARLTALLLFPPFSTTSAPSAPPAAAHGAARRAAGARDGRRLGRRDLRRRAAAAVDEKAVLATAGAAALGFAAGSLTPVQASANRLLAERLGAKIRGTLVCRNQIFNPTSMCAYATVSTQAFRLCFENSTRAIDSSKNQPNRLRFDRAQVWSGPPKPVVGFGTGTLVSFGGGVACLAVESAAAGARLAFDGEARPWMFFGVLWR